MNSDVILAGVRITPVICDVMSNLVLDRDIDNLLGELCVKMGFCLPPGEHDRIASLGSWEAESFAKDVVASEGLNPEYETKHVRNIRNKFVEVFGSNVYTSKNS